MKPEVLQRKAKLANARRHEEQLKGDTAEEQEEMAVESSSSRPSSRSLLASFFELQLEPPQEEREGQEGQEEQEGQEAVQEGPEVQAWHNGGGLGKKANTTKGEGSTHRAPEERKKAAAAQKDTRAAQQLCRKSLAK